MYFASRVQAGRMLAAKLTPKYRYENCAVVALSDGGVMVGAQVASQLHCVLTLIMSSEINLPQEPEAIASIAVGGTMSYNRGSYTDAQLHEFHDEYRGYIEQEKLARIHELNKLVGAGGTMSKDLLKHQNIIVVTDGIKSGFEVDLVVEFLKPVEIAKLVVATPLASVEAVDRMHVLADDLYCLSVIDGYIDTSHYYETQDVPDHETVLKTLEHVILNWQ